MAKKKGNVLTNQPCTVLNLSVDLVPQHFNRLPACISDGLPLGGVHAKEGMPCPSVCARGSAHMDHAV